MPESDEALMEESDPQDSSRESLSKSQWERLAAPFAPTEVKWVVIAVPDNKGGGAPDRCLVAPYYDATEVFNRLDAVVGPNRWRMFIEHVPQAGFICTIEIYSEAYGWIAKTGVGMIPRTENKALHVIFKGDESDAIKRAGHAWNIGRIYRNESFTGWMDYDPKKKQPIGPCPLLPDALTPSNYDQKKDPSSVVTDARPYDAVFALNGLNIRIRKYLKNKTPATQKVRGMVMGMIKIAFTDYRDGEDPDEMRRHFLRLYCRVNSGVGVKHWTILAIHEWAKPYKDEKSNKWRPSDYFIAEIRNVLEFLEEVNAVKGPADSFNLVTAEIQDDEKEAEDEGTDAG